MADGVPFAIEVHLERARHLDAAAGSPAEALAIVAVAGEVDLATVPELRSTLSGLMALPRQEVVVDLAAVEFIDASGIGVLVGAAAAAARAGVKFRLKAPSPAVKRVLDLARLDGTLATEL
jgi:anti-sigma B factor antagonist